MTSRLLTVLKKVQNFRPTSFTAPLPISSRVEVCTVQDGVPLRYTVFCKEPGWYHIEPPHKNKSEKYLAIPQRPSEFHEVDEYLSQLPAYWCYVTRPVNELAWNAVPFNLSDARQRGWNGEEKIVSLVTDSLQPLDLIRVRSAAGLLLYEKMDDVGLQFGNSDGKREAQAIVEAIAKQLREQELIRELELEKRRQLETVEGRIRSELEYSGATLDSYHINRDGTYTVTYSHNGLTWTFPKVRKDLRIEVPGLCWAGSERHHNLASAIVKMEEARRQHRPEIPREYYL